MATLTQGQPASAFTPIRPGLRYGPAPQRKRAMVRSTPLDRCIVRIRSKLLPTRLAASDSWLRDIKERVAAIDSLPDFEHRTQFKQLANLLRRNGHDPDSLNETLAHAARAARNTLELNPHDVQLFAAQELLHGRFVEMGTGEGKTITMALAAAVSALDGTPVHVLTASDYLAQRDASWLSPLYSSLGLSAAFVLPEMSDIERRTAYRADVVHVTGKQVAFDWMRDGIAMAGTTQRLSTRLGNLARVETDTDPIPGEPLLRGLCLAIVDEADSLLIDEARTPLVLAAPVADSKIKSEECVVALTLARLLHEGVDFTVSPGMRVVTLTPDGEVSLDRLATRVDGLWRAARYRDERVRDALSVLHCWHRDRDYVVRDNHVELVDPHTGRALQDRRLQRGLHMLLELKERCEATPENDVVASLPFQHFFRNYVRLSGMSGTLHEVRAELASVYGVDVVDVPPDQPSQLDYLPTQIFPTTAMQLDALVQEVQRCLYQGRPVLVGTRTVEQSISVSAALDSYAIAHKLLNASQDTEEAAVVSGAGIAGQVTVATNMAGRGTDIRLGPGVRECGGLHVIALAFNDSIRLDRQLAGRAGRQGDPGTFIRLLSLEDVSLVNASPLWLIDIMIRMLKGQRNRLSRQTHKSPDHLTVSESQTDEVTPVDGNKASGSGLCIADQSVLALVRWIQSNVERHHAAERRRGLDAAEQLTHHIAIGANSRFSS